MSNAMYQANRAIRKNVAIDIIKNCSREFLNFLSGDNGIYKLSKIFSVYKEAENNLIKVFEDYKNGDKFIRDSKEWQMFRNELCLRYDAAREASVIMEKSKITRNDALSYLKICQSLGANINQNRSELLQTLKEINVTERELDNLIHHVNESEREAVTILLDKMGIKELNLLEKKNYDDLLSEAWKLRKESFNKMLAETREKEDALPSRAEFSKTKLNDWVAKNTQGDGVLSKDALKGNKGVLMDRVHKNDSRELLGNLNQKLELEDVCCKIYEIEKSRDNKITIKEQKKLRNMDKNRGK